MGVALYRKYRSKTLDEIVGQTHITSLLSRAISHGKIAHAYLLTGPKGVGKTSIARILAHQINNLPYTDDTHHLDIIEIDAASNNSVEDVRDLREKVQIAPVSAGKKIYIIDEVHMLSKAAFNALLKTLEEPPEHVVFILATTDVDKLPATILSRVQRFNFKAATVPDAAANLRAIATAEHIAIDDAALKLIAQHANGSFRDSVSMLDQLQHTSDQTISRSDVELLLGIANSAIINDLLAAYETGDLPHIINIVEQIESNGTPAALVAEQLIVAAKARISSKPQLLPLMDALLEVQKSSWPHVKLLVALANSASVQPGSERAAMPTRQAAAVPKPNAVKPANGKKPAAQVPAASPVPPVAPAPPKQKNTTPVEFAWADFIAGFKESSMGIFTVLQGCAHHFDGTLLTIYAGRKFNKTKLDKEIAALSASLQALGITNAEIEILPEPKPIEDTQVAEIAAMMGGGQEVSL